MKNNKKTTKWLILVEENGYEHETWCFWFPYNENNKKAFDIIKEKLEKDDGSCEAEFGTTVVDGITKDVIIQLPDTGLYMDEHQVYDTDLDIEEIKKIKDEEIGCKLYKGGITDFIKE